MKNMVAWVGVWWGLGPGSGCPFFFPNPFVSIFVLFLLYRYFLMFGIFPSFMVESIKENKVHIDERNIFVCCLQLREFVSEIGVFAGNICKPL